MSATRGALSRSMANLDFDPLQAKRRARAQRSKRDLSMSCSAFHYVLDKDEMNEQKSKTIDSSRRHDVAAGASSNKPSYSDLIMDATSKSHYSPNVTSPTSVTEEEKADLEGATNLTDRTRTYNISSESTSRNVNATTSAKEVMKEPASRRPSRTIPTSNEIHHPRNRQRLQRSKSSEGSFPNTTQSDPITLGGRARSNREVRDGRSAMHMSMVDFPKPSELQVIAPLGVVAKSPRRIINKDRFSRSFSGFDGWNPNDDLKSKSDHADEDFTNPLTPTQNRRGGKRPARLERSKKDTKSREEEGSELGGLEGARTTNLDDNKDNSLSEMEIFGVALGVDEELFDVNTKSRTRTKSSHGCGKSTKHKVEEKQRIHKCAKSLSSFDVSAHDLVSTTSGTSATDDPTASTGTSEPSKIIAADPRRRRSSKKLNPDEFFARDEVLDDDDMTLGAATHVETQKLSLEEFHKSWTTSADDDVLFASPSKAPTQRVSRNKRDPGRGGSGTRHAASSPRLRRTNTHDGAVRPTLSRRESSRRRLKQEPSTSKDPEIRRKGRGASRGPEAKSGSNAIKEPQTERSDSKEPGIDRHHRSSSRGKGEARNYIQGSAALPEKSIGTVYRSVSPSFPDKPSYGVHRSVSQGHSESKPSLGVHHHSVSQGHPVGRVRRSVSRDGKRNRRSSGVTRANVDDGGDDPHAPLKLKPRRGSDPECANGTISPAHRRAPLRTRSSDGSTLRPMRDRSTATAMTTREAARIMGRQTATGSRTTRSTDGGCNLSVRRGSTGANNNENAMRSNLQKSLSSIPARSLPSRSFSGSGDRSVMSEHAVLSRSTSYREAVKNKPSQAAPRRNTPQRSKSHDGSKMAFVRRTPKERTDSAKESRDSGRSNIVTAPIASLSKAERRAAVHKLMAE